MEFIIVSTALSAVILILLAFIIYLQREHQKQVRTLVDALMSRSPSDYLALKTLDKPEDDPVQAPDLQPLGNLSDEDFLNTIQRTE